MTQQLAYTQDPVRILAGYPADTGPNDPITYFVAPLDASPPASQPALTSAAIPAGVLVVRSPDATGQRPIGQVPLGVALDVDAIVETTASPAVPTTFSGAQLDGEIGGASIAVSAPVQLVLDSNTDWDATTAVLTAVDGEGLIVTEDLAIPDGGNTTLTTTTSYSRVISLFIPAQTGTNGNWTLGYAASNAVGPASILGVARRDSTGQGPLDSDQGETVACALRFGRVGVDTEDQVTDGAQAFVRIVATGAEQIGAWRSDADGGDAVVVPGARFYRAISASLAILEIDFKG